MIKKLLNRAKRTIADTVFYVAPVWHLTNLRREAYDQVEDLHYQVGYCRANKQQIVDRIAELDLILARVDDENEKFALESEKRQLEVQLQETEAMEAKAREVVDTYQETLPNIVRDLDLAIQMTRMNKSQKSVVKMLGSSKSNDGSDIHEHIKKTRSQAYALGEQLEGQLASNRLKKGRLLTSNVPKKD